MYILNSLKNLLGVNKVQELSIIDKLTDICEPFPYNNILAEQELSVEHYHKSGYALVRDNVTELRYVAKIEFLIKDFELKQIVDNPLFKAGDLDVDVSFSFRLNRVSKSVSVIQSKYTGECIYKTYLDFISRVKA